MQEYKMSSFLHFLAVAALLSACARAQITSAPPAIVIHPPAYTTIPESQTVRMTCAAYGIPAPSISWSRGKGDLASLIQDPESGVTVYSKTLTVNGTDFTVSILEICGVDPKSHTDQYSCMAANGVGGQGVAASQAAFFLSVTGSPVVPPSIVVRPPKNTTVDYGITIEAVCVAYGNPVPDVAWSKRGDSCSNISSSSSTKIYNEVVTYNGISFRKSVLQLCDVTQSDGGWYSCDSYNGIPGDGLTPRTWPWGLSVAPPPPPPPSSTEMLSEMSSTFSPSLTPTPSSVGTTSASSSNGSSESVFIAIMILEALVVLVLILALVGVTLFALKMTKSKRNLEKLDMIPNAPRDPRIRSGVENPLHSDDLDEYESHSMTYAELAEKLEYDGDGGVVLPDD